MASGRRHYTTSLHNANRWSTAATSYTAAGSWSTAQLFLLWNDRGMYRIDAAVAPSTCLVHYGKGIAIHIFRCSVLNLTITANDGP